MIDRRSSGDCIYGVYVDHTPGVGDPDAAGIYFITLTGSEPASYITALVAQETLDSNDNSAFGEQGIVWLGCFRGADFIL
mgnify:CR=1 FL=1